MSTILVTGGAGFIGSHLCEKLILLGYNIICLDNFNDCYDPLIKRSNVERSLRHSHYKLIEGDILDGEMVDNLVKQFNIETIIHLAALAGVRRSILTPLDYIDTDIKGTVTLLESCKKHGIKRFIFASSSSVYGNCTSPFREENPLSAQTSPYAAAKHSGELYCRTYHLLYGIPTVCLRFFTVYGPRQRPDMAIHIFTKAIHEGREICIYGDGNSSRDYTYVDDIIDGIVASLNLQRDFEVINLGNSNTVHIMDLVAMIESKLAKPARIRFLPEQPGDVPATCADISKAVDLLGYDPKVKLDEGIERFAAWYEKSSDRS